VSAKYWLGNGKVSEFPGVWYKTGYETASMHEGVSDLFFCKAASFEDLLLPLFSDTHSFNESADVEAGWTPRFGRKVEGNARIRLGHGKTHWLAGDGSARTDRNRRNV